ncbi:UDP-glucose 4-epimerase [Pseudoalteromonas sp. A601]|uniref:UDP-glucose 4-epimerase family protein n=1 Tax=Pseudoalteromonas sp. A601 TaxID=1967839 RepID=UPI000B3BE4EC|nr:SDR family oxidoreductase [Pseudoalteromonas sp. A601]OUS70473.1 UDP-glucose 4-epimerase [Pseudoalteromonas sp. A601]
MIALTGYTGFVGQHLLELLNTTDCLLLGRNTLANYSRFYEFDLSQTNDLDLVSKLSKVDVLVHIAARVHIMNDDSTDPLAEFRAINTDSTLNLAKQAAQAGVKRFIFVSSIKVNGESTTDRPPFTANENPAPEDPYGLSKAEAEQQLLELGKQTGMEIVIIRPPLVYGEGVKANFASLMRFVGKGLPLPFRSIKSNKRSLVSVYNLVDLIKTCIEHPKAANQVFLTSDDYDLSTAEIVALMAKVQGKKNLALPVPVWCFGLVGKLLNKSDVIDRLTGSLQLDITHTKNTLDWAPPYSVEHGFKLAAKKP